jgi:hypothetical protein
MVFKTDQKRISIICFMMIGFINSGLTQPLNYKNIFGSDWENAVAFVEDNKSWIEPKLDKYDIPYSLAIAVVFPELVRYSALRDKMEITLCKALYINRGEKYADFSIGVFQMKPSFAEVIRERSQEVSGRKSHLLFKDRSEYPDNTSFRSSIIKDMENPETQLNYLVAFFKICESSFKLNRKDVEARLKFLATAYNYGINKESEQIESMVDKKFYNTRLLQTDNYSYADVSLFWYREYMKNSQYVNQESKYPNR